ncbi:MAG: pyridoxamine 5'-phosphate oxidase [Flavobacteriaceae bacterium]|nr:pyridoxamine 5'-phosphate oxidase [Flavobacteriaceae bacterium]MAU31386.1 pyridoxamine 5'-phosphate oxidase [Flavobacteriaceae bacterium]|tara:strand:+ start:4686 stop:5333 length:648 start_codon:yes stop_codon:yes gene_type:complete
MLRDVSNLRKSYTQNSLEEVNLPSNPFSLFDNWFKEVKSTDSKFEVNAMTLSTIDSNGYPNARIVLLKFFSNEGFIFFTNYNSNKAISIENNNKVSISFFWEDFERQVIIKGHAKKTNEDLSTKYFNSRPKGSQIGALVSERQSSVIPSKDFLIEKFNSLIQEFDNKDISRPENWGGFIVNPIEYEFWQGGENRLHDRIRYKFVDNLWKIDRLSP